MTEKPWSKWKKIGVQDDKPLTLGYRPSTPLGVIAAAMGVPSTEYPTATKIVKPGPIVNYPDGSFLEPTPETIKEMIEELEQAETWRDRPPLL